MSLTRQSSVARTLLLAAAAGSALAAPAPDALAQGVRYQSLSGNASVVDETFGIARDHADDAVLSVGFTASFSDDLFAARRNDAGELLWASTYNTVATNAFNRDRGSSVAFDAFDGAGYVLAGTTNAPTANADRLDNLLIGIQPNGDVRFAAQYIGTAFSDQAHLSLIRAAITSAPAIIQSQADGHLFVVAHNANNLVDARPMAFRTDPDGALIAAADYRFPQALTDRVGFTDIVELPPGSAFPDRTFALVGSALDTTGERDVFLMVVSETLTPLLTRRFDATTTKPGANAPASASGLAVTFDHASSQLAIVGVTDLGAAAATSGFPAFAAPHVLRLDADDDFAVVDWSVYDPALGASFNDQPPALLPSWEPSFTAATNLGAGAQRQLVIAGTALPPSSGPEAAAAFAVDASGDLVWSQAYANFSFGRALAPGADCGVALAGSYSGLPGLPPFSPFAPIADYALQTDADGTTGCFERAVPFQRQTLQFQTQTLNAFFNPLQGQADVSVVRNTTDNAVLVCSSDACPDLPCPADANGDGLVNADDLLIVLGNFGQPASGPAEGDLNDDALVNADDLLIVLAAFGDPCP